MCLGMNGTDSVEDSQLVGEHLLGEPDMNRAVGGNRRKSSQAEEEGHQLLLAAAAHQPSPLPDSPFPRFLGEPRKHFHS
jgi:hypothetical protein